MAIRTALVEPRPIAYQKNCRLNTYEFIRSKLDHSCDRQGQARYSLMGSLLLAVGALAAALPGLLTEVTGISAAVFARYLRASGDSQIM